MSTVSPTEKNLVNLSVPSTESIKPPSTNPSHITVDLQHDTHVSNLFPNRGTSLDPENLKHSRNVGPDGKPLGPAPATAIQDGHRPQWITIGPKVDRIVEVISRHIHKSQQDDKFESLGRKAMTELVSQYVQHNERIVLVFPGFPFKSPSRRKVLGSLPDYGEELLLRKLDILARTIQDYHPPGALIYIVSDGIAFGEMLGQSDSVVYRYTKELKRMCDEFSLTNIAFVRVADLFTNVPFSDMPVTESEYVESAPAVRAQFLQHVVPGFDLEARLKQDVGTLKAYLGYLKVLVHDLPGINEGLDGKPLPDTEQDGERGIIAKSMLKNGAIFAHLIEQRFPKCIRLSMHPQDNAGPKYAFQMPVGEMSNTPWHNVVKEEIDGTLTIAPYYTFDPDTYDVVHRYGRPYYLRTKSEVFDLGEKITPHVEFIRNYPFGMVIKADPAANLSHGDLPMNKVRKLALRYSLLLFQGFAQSDKETFRRVAHTMGEVVYWQYGDILELKDTPTVDMNSSLTNESMAMHYDGIFKTKTDPKTNTLTHDPATFQVFLCVQAPEKTEGGKTLISNTASLIRDGLTPEQRTWLKDKQFGIYTPANSFFGGEPLKLPLVMRNENTGHDVVRWHEAWPQWVTGYKPTRVFVDGVSPEVSQQIGDHITDLLYDRRWCLSHAWTTGDLLIADNIELMHTRTAFKPCPRELWRIHVN